MNDIEFPITKVKNIYEIQKYNKYETIVELPNGTCVQQPVVEALNEYFDETNDSLKYMLVEGERVGKTINIILLPLVESA